MARVPLTDEQAASNAVVLNLKNVGISPEQFFRLCRDNDHLRLELSAQKELIMMSPAGGRTGRRNMKIAAQLTVWETKDGTGLSFDSNTMFALPNGALRAPDASWLLQERWDALSAEQQEGFPPLCPDFVLELTSISDSVKPLMAKMDEYIANGARLGWLIDPYQRQVHIYRPGKPVQTLDDPASVSGDPVLPGFILDLTKIW